MLSNKDGVEEYHPQMPFVAEKWRVGLPERLYARYGRGQTDGVTCSA